MAPHSLVPTPKIVGVRRCGGAAGGCVAARARSRHPTPRPSRGWTARIRGTRPHAALLADLLGDSGLVVVVRIEDAGVEAATGPQHPPFEFSCVDTCPPNWAVVNDVDTRTHRRGPPRQFVNTRSGRGVARRHCHPGGTRPSGERRQRSTPTRSVAQVASSSAWCPPAARCAPRGRPDGRSRAAPARRRTRRPDRGELEAEVVHGRRDVLAGQPLSCCSSMTAPRTSPFGEPEQHGALDVRELGEPLTHLVVGGELDEHRGAQLARLGDDRVVDVELGPGSPRR
jgi:hypothetical protein